MNSACLGRMLKRWERREGPAECAETVEDEHSDDINGLDAVLEREGIASGCREEKRGLVWRSEATRHSPKSV